VLWSVLLEVLRTIVHVLPIIRQKAASGLASNLELKYEDFPAVEKNDAFDKLVASIASLGLQVTNSNKDLGIISATNTVSYGQGKTVPLNAVVKNIKPKGIRVELVFTLSGGLATSADTVQDRFCTLLASVSN
jgi:DNA-binding transcriptional regulator LsrR (DeoR family)